MENNDHDSLTIYAPSITTSTRSTRVIEIISQKIHQTTDKLKRRASLIRPIPTKASKERLGDDPTYGDGDARLYNEIGTRLKEIGGEETGGKDHKEIDSKEIGDDYSSSSSQESSDSEDYDDGRDATGTKNVSDTVNEEGEGLAESRWQCESEGHQRNLPSTEAQDGSNVIPTSDDPSNAIVLSWCQNCCTVLCDDCWDKAPGHGHKPQRVNLLGIRANHTKVPVETASMLATLMTPTSNTPHDHVNALESKWFGVTIGWQGDGDDVDRHQAIHLDTTSRYRELSMDAKPTEHQFPALVSFIGETGSGKSSLVRALVKVYPLPSQFIHQCNH